MAAVPSYKLANGLSFPCIGLGTYAITGRSCVQTVATAIDLGYRLIDTASFYHNEAEVGEGVRKSSVPREQVFVATKLYPNQFGHAARAIDEALRKLDLDYLDMMLLHHPAGNDVQAYRAIEDAIQAGKIRFAGISCYYQEELTRFLPQISVKPLLVQNEVHPFYQDTAVVDYIQKQGLLVQSWYPLGGRGYTQELFGHKTNELHADLRLRFRRVAAPLLVNILKVRTFTGMSTMPPSSWDKTSLPEFVNYRKSVALLLVMLRSLPLHANYGSPLAWISS